MIYKEIVFIKSQWKKYILDFLLLFCVVAYYIYKGNNLHITFFLGIVVPGIITTLQVVESSVMLEKKNGMFEKMLSVYSVRNILLPKIMAAFAAGVLVSSICGLGIGIVIFKQGLAQVGMPVMISIYLITVCMEWTWCIVLVMLFVFINRIILINICVMGIVMMMAMLSSNVPMDNSIIAYDVICSSIILAIGFVVLHFMRYVSRKTFL